jgi:hypothetical protein
VSALATLPPPPPPLLLLLLLLLLLGAAVGLASQLRRPSQCRNRAAYLREVCST